MNITELRYLVAIMKWGSVSAAAKQLYAAQPNVSKVIRMLEDELEFPVFVRQSRGITLTARGQRVYEYASRAVENIEQLKSFSRMDKGEELLASWNPSSWMASCFAAFYQKHRQEDVCYHVMTAGTKEILERCQTGKDDIGFVYVLDEQMPSFQYRLECAGLIFQELKRTKAYLYFGKDHPLAGKSGIEKIALDEVRLVQCYEDEYTLGRRRTEETDRISPEDRMKISGIPHRCPFP